MGEFQAILKEASRRADTFPDLVVKRAKGLLFSQRGNCEFCMLHDRYVRLKILASHFQKSYDNFFGGLFASIEHLENIQLKAFKTAQESVEARDKAYQHVCVCGRYTHLQQGNRKKSVKSQDPYKAKMNNIDRKITEMYCNISAVDELTMA